jgi:hypothetical protein
MLPTTGDSVCIKCGRTTDDIHCSECGVRTLQRWPRHWLDHLRMHGELTSAGEDISLVEKNDQKEKVP